MSFRRLDRVGEKSPAYLQGSLLSQVINFYIIHRSQSQTMSYEGICEQKAINSLLGKGRRMNSY